MPHSSVWLLQQEQVQSRRVAGRRQEERRRKEEGGECFDAIQPHGTTWTEQAADEVPCVRVEALLHGYLYMHRVPVLVVDKRATDSVPHRLID